MRKFKSLLAALVLINLVGLAAAPTVHADVNDFTVTSFTSDETLSRADPQGELHIIERINVDFTDQNHGILRAIPKSYHGHPLQLQVNKVSSDSYAPAQYTTYDSSGNTVLKIGDPNRTVTGTQEYTIDYTVRNVITFYKDHDELYWNVNGNQWSQPFEAVSATLHLPAGLNFSSDKPICYTGSYGSSATNCLVTAEGKTLTIDNTLPLSSGQTMSFVVGFQKGYFQPASFWDNVKDESGPIIELGALPLLALIVGFTWWYKRGRDAKGRGTIVPEYAPPQGLSPLEAGTVADFKVDNRDITATIIDLARRGYLQIIENTTKHVLRKATTTYTLVLKNNDYSSLNPYEIQLMAALFSDKALDAPVELSDLKNKLYQTATDLRKSVEASLTAQGYFRRNPLKYAVKWSFIPTILVLVLYVFGGSLLQHHSALFVTIGVAVATAIFLFFLNIMPARTAQGVAAKEQLLGLKMYMEVAEKARLEKLEGPRAAYAADAGAPTRTVELFEKLLPYAIVLGVENEWAAQFADIYTTPPQWYAGNWTSFNAGYLAGSLSAGFATAINTSFSAPRSSGSSGFGGGGFAGGGGGGGGGGGW